MLRKYFIIIMSLTVFCSGILKAKLISVLPLAQEVVINTNEEKRIFFRVYNQSKYTQNVQLELQNWKKEGIVTNISWTIWCFPEEKEFIVAPDFYKDVYFKIKLPKKKKLYKHDKLMVMCFFSKSKINKKKLKQLFSIKTRIGVAIYAKAKLD